MAGNWRKSSRSTPNGGNCVEARLAERGPQIRDSKMGDASPILAMSRDDLAALLRVIR